MADDRTQISIDLKADGFIDSLDKASAKAEDFGDRCVKSMDVIDKHTDKMTKNQQRAYEAMKASYDKNSKAIKDMEAEYEKLRAKQKAGEKLTEDEYKRLRELSKEYSNASRAIANTAKDMESLIKRNKELNSAFQKGEKSAQDFADVLKVAFGNVLAEALEKAISLAMELAKQIVELGLKAQQTVSQLNAMKNNIMGGAQAYEQFNNVLRNTNWQEETVMNMGKQFMNLGYTATQASEMIQILADTSAGLGSGESGAVSLMQTLNKIKSTAQFTAKDMKSLQQEGLHVEEAFAKAFGVSTQEALEKIKEGAVDGQQAFEIIANYMQNEFTDSMNESKNNLTDMWGDITGNIQTMLGDIGKAIADGFGKTDILQGMIDVTNEWVEDVRKAIVVVREDFAPLFELLGNIAGGAFKILNAGISLAISVFKVAYEVIQPFLQALMEVFRWCNSVADSIGNLWRKMGKAFDEANATGYYEGDNGLDLGADAEAPSVTGYKGAGKYTFNTKPTETKAGSGGSAKTAKDDSLQKAREALNRSLAETKQRYNDIKEQVAETRKGEDALTRATDAYNNKALSGQALIDAQNKQKLRDMETEKKRLEDDHKARLKMLEEYNAKLIEARDAGLIDGSDARLQEVANQMTQEQALHDIRIKNLDALIEKQKEASAVREDTEKKASTAVQDYWDGQASAFASSMADCIMNAKSFGEAFKEIIKGIIQQLIQALIYATLLSAFGGGATGGFGNFGKNFGKSFFGRADGGLVLGAGTGTSDSIPTMLSNGEYVINAEATKKNLPLLNAINYGNPVARFAEGGLVGGSSGGGAGSSVVLNLSTIDADSFSSFLSRGGMKAIKQAMLDDERNLNSAFGTF